MRDEQKKGEFESSSSNKGYLSDWKVSNLVPRQDPFNDPRLAILEDISVIIGASSDIKKLLLLIIDSAAHVMGAEASSLLLLDKERGKLYFEAATGEKSDDVKGFELNVGEGIAGWVAKTGEPLLVEDVYKESRWCKKISDAVDYTTKSIICAPMRVGGEVIGVMQIINRRDGKTFEGGDLALLSAFAKVASTTIKNARSYQSMENENLNLKKELTSRYSIVGEAEIFKGILMDAFKAARGRTTVLITGESGTGKELLARYVHDYSDRKKAPFIVVNCAAIPENLIESELFGHEKGAFTGAVSRQTGKFELACGGTIFLDEIGEMPMNMQVKLLRVLQESEIERVGGQGTIKIDVRVIAATNRDLGSMMDEGRFRRDLYFRLHVIGLTLPPLRERKDDILLLVNTFIERYNKELNKNFKDISDEALKYLLGHDWKGNVRELQNLIERIIALEDGPVILPEHIPSELKDEKRKTCVSAGTSLKDAINSFKKGFVSETLELTGGNKTKAAKILGIQRSYLSKMAKELGVD